MRRLILVSAGWILAASATACHTNEPEPTGALATALAHSRTVVASGEIQVSPDTIASAVDETILAEASQEAGFAFGSDGEAVRCQGFLGCEAVGAFRGLAHVVEYEAPTADSIVVKIRVLRFAPELGPLYERVDEVHVTRAGSTEPWQIANVVGISES